jgi:hypothetical protein
VSKVRSEAGPFPRLLLAKKLTAMFVKLKHEVDDTSNTLLQIFSPHEEAGIVDEPHVSPVLEAE